MNLDCKVKDIELANWGRKEIAIAETEMPGLMTIREENKSNKYIEQVQKSSTSTPHSYQHMLGSM